MKRSTFTLIFLYILVHFVNAQEPRFIFDNDSLNKEMGVVPPVKIPAPKSSADTIPYDSLNKILPEIPAWRIDERFGSRVPVEMDTLFNNYSQKSLMDGRSVAMGYLGNWGSPAQSKIFFERDETSQFNFLDPFKYYYKRADNHTFLDTKDPYSNFTYHSGGGRKSKEEYFTGIMSLSFNKKFTIGFDVDYIYARGFYNYLANKQTNYSLFSSYITDKYQMHAFFAQNNYTNSENGGLDIEKSMESDFFDGDAKSLETNMQETWNKLRGRQLFMTHKYSIGFEDEKNENFVPVASLIYTSNYRDQKRNFISNNVGMLDELYNYVPRAEISGPSAGGGGNLSGEGGLNISDLNDRMSYYSFKNTLGISLNEGFRDWVKFGLMAFIENDVRKYTMPSLNYTSLSVTKYSQNSTTIGGVLSKQKGEFLRYNVSAELGVLGYNAGESRLKADVTTRFNIKGKETIVKANAYIKNLKPTFYEANFTSRYYNWTDKGSLSEEYPYVTYRKRSDVKRVYVGGEIYLPFTKTRLSGGVENLKNYFYYDKVDDTRNVELLQAGENVQVISLRLDQKFNLGVLNFDNQLVFQTSSNEDVIPLPKLSLYSNLYLQFKVAKVLDVQFGVDAHYHTEYHAPGYDPALLQFYNQHQRKVGKFPFSTAYANFHLKKTRFFVMMYNVGKTVTDRNYYIIDQYAANPMVFKFGLSWNFTN